MKPWLTLLFLLVSGYSYAATDLGTQDVAPKCVENPCTSYRFPPFCKDVSPRDGICDGYTFQTWTQNSAITSVPAICNAGDDATANPDIHPVFSFTGSIGGTTCSGTTCAGVSINAATGAITGTPNVKGAVNLSVSCKNDLSPTGRSDVLAGTVNDATSGTSYYVDCAAGDDNTHTGLSNAQAWRTVGKVNSTVTTVGANVYFKDNTNCTGELDVDWGGSANDWAVIGTYWMNGGTETVGVSVAKAKISGTYTAACSPHLGGSGGCLINNANAIPTSLYHGLIHITSEYVQVQDMNPINSAGEGITIDSVSYTQGRSNFRIWRNKVDVTAEAGILCHACRYAHIFDNEVVSHNIGGGKCDALYGAFNSGIAVAVMGISNPLPGYNIIEKNVVHEGCAEALQSANGEYNLWRGNTAYANANVDYYCAGCSHEVYEYNIGTGKNPAEGFTAPACFAVSLEDFALAWEPTGIDDVTIRGNMCVNAGIVLGMEQQSAAAGRKYSNVRFYNNTIVGDPQNPGAGFVLEYALTNANFATNGVTLQDNVFWRTAGSTPPCTIAGGVTTNFLRDHNLWWIDPVSMCDGTGDKYADPQLAGSNWNLKYTTANKPVPADFVLGASSPALAMGLPRLSTILSTSNFPLYTVITYPFATFDLKQSEKDATGATRNATTPDAGSQER